METFIDSVCWCSVLKTNKLFNYVLVKYDTANWNWVGEIIEKIEIEFNREFRMDLVEWLDRMLIPEYSRKLWKMRGMIASNW